MLVDVSVPTVSPPKISWNDNHGTRLLFDGLQHVASYFEIIRATLVVDTPKEVITTYVANCCCCSRYRGEAEAQHESHVWRHEHTPLQAQRRASPRP